MVVLSTENGRKEIIMFIYDKLNQKNIKHFMEHNYDESEDIYGRVWDAIYVLGACGFKDMKKLHEVMVKIDDRLYDER